MLLSDWAGPQQHFFLFGWQIQASLCCQEIYHCSEYLISGTAIGKKKYFMGFPLQVRSSDPRQRRFQRRTVHLQAPQLSQWLLKTWCVFFILAGARVVFKFRISSSGRDSFLSGHFLPPEHMNVPKLSSEVSNAAFLPEERRTSSTVA